MSYRMPIRPLSGPNFLPLFSVLPRHSQMATSSNLTNSLLLKSKVAFPRTLVLISWSRSCAGVQIFSPRSQGPFAMAFDLPLISMVISFPLRPVIWVLRSATLISSGANGSVCPLTLSTKWKRNKRSFMILGHWWFSQIAFSFGNQRCASS